MMRRKSESGKRGVLIVKAIKSPMAALSKALDSYAKWISNFAVNYNRPLMIMEVLPNSHHLHRSLSDSDYLPGPLIRAISTTNTATQAVRIANSSAASENAMCSGTRSVGFRMGTIYEDRACSFRDHGGARNKKLADKICFVVNYVCQ